MLATPGLLPCLWQGLIRKACGSRSPGTHCRWLPLHCCGGSGHWDALQRKGLCCAAADSGWDAGLPHTQKRLPWSYLHEQPEPGPEAAWAWSGSASVGMKREEGVVDPRLAPQNSGSAEALTLVSPCPLLNPIPVRGTDVLPVSRCGTSQPANLTQLSLR